MAQSGGGRPDKHVQAGKIGDESAAVRVTVGFGGTHTLPGDKRSRPVSGDNRIRRDRKDERSSQFRKKLR